MPCGAGAGPVRPEVPCPRAMQVALAKSSPWHEEQVPAPKQRGWHLCTCCRAGGHLAHACAPGVCPPCHPAPAPAASASGSGLPGHRGQQGAGRARGPAWAGVQMHILKIPPRNPAPGGAPSGCTVPGAGGGEGAAAETSQSPGIVGAPPDGEMGATPCPPTRGGSPEHPRAHSAFGQPGKRPGIPHFLEMSAGNFILRKEAPARKFRADSARKGHCTRGSCREPPPGVTPAALLLGDGCRGGGSPAQAPRCSPPRGRAVTAPLAPGAPHAVRSPASTEHQSRGDTVYVTHTKGRNKERGTERRGKFHLPTGSHAQTPKKRGKREREEGKGSAALSRARGGAGHLGACWALAPLLPAPSCSQPRGALRLLF